MQSNSSPHRILQDIPSTLSKKYCTFGYGNKYFISMSEQKKAFELPAPGIYEVSKKQRQGSSFGKDDRFRQGKVNNGKPGPGSYNISQIRTKKSFSLYARPSENKSILSTPSPNAYNPKIDRFMPSRFNAIGFGFGDKMDFSKNKLNIPGPNVYHIRGVFDKYQLFKK